MNTLPALPDDLASLRYEDFVAIGRAVESSRNFLLGDLACGVEARYGDAPAGDLRVAIASASPPATQTQPATSRPRVFDASEGTRLDPLLNKTYDLSYAKVIPSDLK